MSTSELINEPERRQSIRTRIQRSRRRLDRHADRLVEQVLITGSWRRYVETHPGRSMLAALGTGLAMGSTGWTGRIGQQAADWAANAASLKAFDACRDWLTRGRDTEEIDEFNDQ